MGVRPCLRRSRAMIFSSSPVRLPVRTLPSDATARKKKVAIRGGPFSPAEAQRRRGRRGENLSLCSLRFLCVSASLRGKACSSEFLGHSHDLFHGGHAGTDHAP